MVIYGPNASEALKCGSFLSLPYRSIWDDEPSRSYNGVSGAKKPRKAAASQSIYVPTYTSSTFKGGNGKKPKSKTTVTLKPASKVAIQNPEKSSALIASSLVINPTIPIQDQGRTFIKCPF